MIRPYECPFGRISPVAPAVNNGHPVCARFFDLSFEKDCPSWGQNLSMVFFRQSVSASLQQERTIVLLVHDYFRGQIYKSLLLHNVRLLSTDIILPTFLSTLTFLSFFDS